MRAAASGVRIPARRASSRTPRPCRALQCAGIRFRRCVAAIAAADDEKDAFAGKQPDMALLRRRTRRNPWISAPPAARIDRRSGVADVDGRRRGRPARLERQEGVLAYSSIERPVTRGAEGAARLDVVVERRSYGGGWPIGRVISCWRHKHSIMIALQINAIIDSKWPHNRRWVSQRHDRPQAPRRSSRCVALRAPDGGDRRRQQDGRQSGGRT